MHNVGEVAFRENVFRSKVIGANGKYLVEKLDKAANL
jgi:hypothetical protein